MIVSYREDRVESKQKRLSSFAFHDWTLYWSNKQGRQALLEPDQVDPYSNKLIQRVDK